MNKIADYAEAAEPILGDTTGDLVYARFLNEPNSLAIAVVNEDNRPVGLVDRNRFFLAMAAEFGRALYAKRPITYLMEPPEVLQEDASVLDFMGRVISTDSAGLMRGFIVVDKDGRYRAVGTPLSLLEAGYAAAKDRVTQLDRQAARLARANTKAEAAARAKAQFLATMSHEIRTPLNGVLAVAEIIEIKLAQEELRPYVRTILDSGQTLHRLLTDALDLSRAEAGAMELIPAPFDAIRMAEDIRSLWSPLAESKALEFEVRVVAEDRRPLLADAMRLKQVANNLIGNALKFTTSGRIDVALTVKSVDDNAILKVEVADTGPGLEADQLERIFEPFAKADEHAAAGGAGLGLAICRKLIDSMDGRLWVESEPGKGARFAFETVLPFALIGVSEAPTAEVANISQTEEPARVLIVDDNATNRMVASTLLQMAGFEHHLAEDGQAAVAACAETAFDLILMDINMPVMGGMESTRRIRAMSGPNRHIPILAVTANTNPAEAAAYLAAGMSGLVQKPLKAAELFGAIQECLTPTSRDTAAA